MADRSAIEWTEATWNPVVGCDIVSPGCTNCYAMKDAWRKNANPRLPRYHGLTKMSKGGPVWTGEVRTVPELLDWPLRKRKPLRIFVNSMSDLFNEDVPDDFIVRVFDVIRQSANGYAKKPIDRLVPTHVFQILTKRAERMQQFMHRLVMTPNGLSLHDSGPLVGPLLKNVWLGVSIEDQRRADERIPLLLQTPAAVRWISAEPLLGPVSLRWLAAWDGQALKPRAPGVETNELDGLRKLDWVVVGGESGPGARPFDIAWARSLRDQCRAAGVPFFCKQLGAHVAWNGHQNAEEHWPGFNPPPHEDTGLGYWRVHLKDRKGGDMAEWPEELRVREYPA